MPEDRTIPDQASAAPRQTLAMRLAERSRQREQRAERLARLHLAPAGAVAGAVAADDAAAPADDDAEAALEDFLRALTGGGQPPAPAAPAEPAAVLHFQRPDAAAAAAPAAPTDLDRLPGAGPGLVRALQRAGLVRLADVAPLAPEDLAARLGPLGRLVPAAAWIDAAREAAAPA